MCANKNGPPPPASRSVRFVVDPMFERRGLAKSTTSRGKPIHGRLGPDVRKQKWSPSTRGSHSIGNQRQITTSRLTAGANKNGPLLERVDHFSPVVALDYPWTC